MSEALLDASALLALLNDEPGQERVAAVLPGARIIAVNLAEAAAKLLDYGVPPRSTRTSLAEIGIAIEPFSAEMAWEAALLRSATRTLGLSLGDRACLAGGRVLGLPVLTADRAWAELDLGIEIEVIR